MPVRTRSQEALDRAAEEAELLEAAEEQARAEEAISQRLPREVLNITKHLQQQQLSVDELHGNINNLTEMVAQLVMNSTASDPSQQLYP